MIVLSGDDLNYTIDNFSIPVKNDILSIDFKILTNELVSRKYQIDNTELIMSTNSIYYISIFNKDSLPDIRIPILSIEIYNVYINVNKDRTKTFPLQFINKYDYLTMTYKRQKHRTFIRRWKEAIYKPKSKYFYKIKDNFEKTRDFPKFP